MGIEFTAEDAFRLAEEVERRGYSFYLQAADACDDPVCGKVFADLAEMERDHEQVFQALRESTGSPSLAEQPHPDRYWPAVAEWMVNDLGQQMTQMFQTHSTPMEILKAAMDFERDSIVFILGVKEMMASGPERRKVDSLLQEEMGHLLSLGSLLLRTVQPPRAKFVQPPSPQPPIES